MFQSGKMTRNALALAMILTLFNAVTMLGQAPDVSRTFRDRINKANPTPQQSKQIERVLELFGAKIEEAKTASYREAVALLQRYRKQGMKINEAARKLSDEQRKAYRQVAHVYHYRELAIERILTPEQREIFNNRESESPTASNPTSDPPNASSRSYRGPTASSASFGPWKNRVQGKILLDFPAGARDKQVALVIWQGRIGYVMVDQLKPPKARPLYSLRPIKPADVQGYFSKQSGVQNANLFIVYLKGDESLKQVNANLPNTDGTLTINVPYGSARKLKSTNVKALFPCNITNWHPKFQETFGGGVTTLPFFAVTGENGWKYHTSIEPLMADRKARKSGVVAGMLPMSGYQVGGFGKGYTKQITGVLINSVDPEGILTYRYGYPDYPTLIDWKSGRGYSRSGSSWPAPKKCGPGIMWSLQLFDSDWEFDEEKRAYLYAKKDYLPLTRGNLNKMSAQEKASLKQFVAHAQREQHQWRKNNSYPPVELPQWDDLNQQDQLEICKSYTHLVRNRRARNAVGNRVMIGAALALTLTSLAPSAAIASTDSAGNDHPQGSRPNGSDQRPTNGRSLKLRFQLPGKPLVGETVLYSVRGPGRWLRSPNRVTGSNDNRELLLDLDQIGRQKIWFLIDNQIIGPIIIRYDAINRRYDDCDVRPAEG